MLQVNSSKPLASVELALVQAAQRHGLNVLSIVHVGQLLPGRPWGPRKDAVVFTVCRPDLSAALLAADMRFANFVPCRIAALEADGAVTLEAMTPSEICGLLQRADLEELAAPLESFLRMIMEEAAQPAAGAQAKRRGARLRPGRHRGDGQCAGFDPAANRLQGTKVEELAGTGQHDAQGG